MADKTPIEPEKKSPLPVVEPEIIPVPKHDVLPKDADFKDGIYNFRKTGKPFALCKHDVDGYGRTHTLKNTVDTWSGTEAEFIVAFEKA
jgi:hypothetical protein